MGLEVKLGLGVGSTDADGDAERDSFWGKRQSTKHPKMNPQIGGLVCLFCIFSQITSQMMMRRNRRTLVHWYDDDQHICIIIRSTGPRRQVAAFGADKPYEWSAL